SRKTERAESHHRGGDGEEERRRAASDAGLQATAVANVGDEVDAVVDAEPDQQRQDDEIHGIDRNAECADQSEVENEGGERGRDQRERGDDPPLGGEDDQEIQEQRAAEKPRELALEQACELGLGELASGHDQRHAQQVDADAVAYGRDRYARGGNEI